MRFWTLMLLLAACDSGDLVDESLSRCGPAGECPPGRVCAKDGLCHASAGADARVSLGGDAPTPDAPLPAVDGPLPAVDAPLPAVDGSVPAVDGPVPAVDGPVSGVDGPVPAVDAAPPPPIDAAPPPPIDAAPPPPDTRLDETPPDVGADATPTFRFSSVPSGATFQCSVDQAAFTTCASPFVAAPLADGEHHFAVRAVGPGGPDPSPAARDFAIDTEGPLVVIAPLPDDVSDVSGEITLSFSEVPVTFACFMDGAPVSCTGAIVRFRLLGYGFHTLRASATDALANLGEATYRWEVQPPRSCRGTTTRCFNDSDCCESPLVPGGTFNRYNRADSPATVSDFRLDRFEVTVGRFAAFVAAGGATQANPPTAGSGAHPAVAGSGWDPAWSSLLPADTAALIQQVKCPGTTAGIFYNWQDERADRSTVPINCVSWLQAAAFCAWDGGRLPSVAELSYAITGGNEQRHFPWSSPPADTTISGQHAAFDCLTHSNWCWNQFYVPVGAKGAGRGRFGHDDLGGNVNEWVIDTRRHLPTPCVDCVELGPSPTATPERALMGGSVFSSAAGLAGSAGVETIHPYPMGYRYESTGPQNGFRCARAP